MPDAVIDLQRFSIGEWISGQVPDVRMHVRLYSNDPEFSEPFALEDFQEPVFRGYMPGSWDAWELQRPLRDGRAWIRSSWLNWRVQAPAPSMVARGIFVVATAGDLRAVRLVYPFETVVDLSRAGATLGLRVTIVSQISTLATPGD